eukprot:gene1437-1641_t
MTKHTLTPDAVQVYDGSVSALEKDLEESAIDYIVASMANVAHKKARRIQSYYREAYKSLITDMGLKLDLLTHELESKESLVERLRSDIKAIEERDSVGIGQQFEEFMKSSGKGLLADMQREKQESALALAKLTTQLEHALDRLEMLRKDNHEILPPESHLDNDLLVCLFVRRYHVQLTAQVNMKNETIAELENREKYLTEELENVRHQLVDAFKPRETIEIPPIKEEDEEEEDDDNYYGKSPYSPQSFMAVSYRLQSLKERSISKVALEVMQAMNTKTDNPPAPGEAMSPGKRPDTSGGGDGKETSLAASHEADRDPRPIEIEEETHFEPRPKLKVSKTVATMAPVTDLLVEYFEAAMAGETNLRGMQHTLLNWANALLVRASSNTKLFPLMCISDLGTNMCDGIIYGLLLKQMKADCGSSWRDRPIDE